MITVFVDTTDKETLTALKNQLFKTVEVPIDLVKTPPELILAKITSLPDHEWISFINGVNISYKNKYKTLIDRSRAYNNVAAVYSDFDVFNKQTNKLDRVLVDPYNIRAWPETHVIPSDAIFSVAAIKEAKMLPTSANFWKTLASKYVFLHCPQSLSCLRV